MSFPLLALNKKSLTIYLLGVYVHVCVFSLELYLRQGKPSLFNISLSKQALFT